jgi:hypothetical protein
MTHRGRIPHSTNPAALPLDIAGALSARYRTFHDEHASAAATPDDVFAALDDAEVVMERRHWHLEVFSVSDDAAGRWIQLGMSGAAEHMITVRLEAGASADRAMAAVSSWLTDPAHESRVVNAF